ncbi:MAG: SprB repeat-containing protein, partial [Fidelibacterota bacterium]
MKNFFTLLILLIWASGGCKDPNKPAYDTLVLEIAVTPASTPIAADGALDLTVTGGKPPLAYSWSNGATTEDIANLSVGIYTVTVTSDDGQTATDSAEITAPPITGSLTDFDGNTYP